MVNPFEAILLRSLSNVVRCNDTPDDKHSVMLDKCFSMLLYSEALLDGLAHKDKKKPVSPNQRFRNTQEPPSLAPFLESCRFSPASSLEELFQLQV